MAQPASNPKIEELRFRLKLDPKSRLFYPLAEELRKVGQYAEAEQVLRGGLAAHGTYLSAWVSLGRVLRELKKDQEAVEALNRALQLDQGNVVAARLLGDAYLTLGEKVEAIKKYKLVHALMPSDQDLAAVIARLDLELNPPRPAPPPPPEPALPPPPEPEPPVEPTVESPMPFVSPEPEAEESPWATPDLTQEIQAEIATGDAEPMLAAHEESPFEEPTADAGYGTDALLIEEPEGVHLARAPLEAEVAEPFPLEEEPPVESAPPFSPEPTEESAAEVFAPAEGVAEPEEDVADTLTMADLYARQGLVDDARTIYEHILQREPDNAAVREKLAALSPAAPSAEDPKRTKVRKLESWLAKVRRTDSRV